DKWNIYYIEDMFYFVHSWNGALKYRAKLEMGDDRSIVTSIEAPPSTEQHDATQSLREVNFLIRTHLFRWYTPVPIPRSAPRNLKDILLFCSDFCGRWAEFASYEDITTHRP